MNYAVITACLNSEKTIERSIDSVLKQEILPYEYIFVDGGSKDATLKIISNKTNNVKNSFKIINQIEKTGITGAWNMALEKITSDIIFILNSDDWYEKDTAKQVMDCFEKNKNAGIVLTSVNFHNPENNSTYIRHNRNFGFFPFLMPVLHPGCFVRQNVYEKYGFYNDKYKISADYDFFYRVYTSGVEFCEIRKALVNMELGGTAGRNRGLARMETREIARKYCNLTVLPEIAYYLRTLTGR